MEDYFMRLISIQKRFKDFKSYVDPKFFLGLFIKHIKDFMKGIRKRILIEMRQAGIIFKTKIGRRYSYDDYFLIDNQFQRCYSMNGGGMQGYN